MELRAVDRTGPIAVEVLEDILPILDVLPEPRELRRRGKRPQKKWFERVRTNFIEPDGSAAVDIENRHQELDSVKIKGCTRT